MNNIYGRRRGQSAFTIVELLIVIIIIAILATVTIVAFTGIQKRAMASTLQDTLTKVARAMDVAAVDTGTYTSFPSTITASSLPKDVGIALTNVESIDTPYCINATTTKYDDLTYRIQKGGSPEEGLCDGEIVDGQTLGDYNGGAGGDNGDITEDPTIMDSRGIATSTSGPMNFRAETDETWSQVTLSWDAVEGATQYRVNRRASPQADWQSTPNNNCTLYSWNHSAGVVSSSVLTYTLRYSNCIPQNASQTFDYRVQYLKDGEWSEWTELSLSPLSSPHRTIPAVKNLSITPAANWSSVTLSWDGIGNFAKLPGVKFRVNRRISSGAPWEAVTNSCNAYAWDHTAGNASPTTLTYSLKYSGCIPQNASQTYEYRVQVYSGNEMGEWSMVSLNPLTYYGQPMPQVTNFTVTPNETWSQVTLNWDGMGSFANIPGAKFRLNKRKSPTDTWMSATTGCVQYAWNHSAGALNPTVVTYSYQYANCVPQAPGQTYEYRIQIYSGSEEGEWTTVQLSR